MDRQCLKNISVNDFKWVKKLSECNSIEFNEGFMKGYDEDSNKGYIFLKQMLNIQKIV